MKIGFYLSVFLMFLSGIAAAQSGPENISEGDFNLVELLASGHSDGFKVDYGQKEERHPSEQDQRICWITLRVSRLQKDTYEMNLHKFRLIDAAGNSIPVFGVHAGEMRDAGYIDIKFIITPYSISGYSLSMEGKTGVEGPGIGKIEIAVSKQAASITILQEPALFTLAFFAPKLVENFELWYGDKSIGAMNIPLSGKTPASADKPPAPVIATSDSGKPAVEAPKTVVAAADNPPARKTEAIRPSFPIVPLKKTHKPHKDAFEIELGFLFGSDLIGYNMDGFVRSENLFLRNQDLVVVERRNGQIVRTTPIDTYDYTEGSFFGGLRGVYYTGDRTAWGIHWFFDQYSQKLVAAEEIGEGDLYSCIALSMC